MSRQRTGSTSELPGPAYRPMPRDLPPLFVNRYSDQQAAIKAICDRYAPLGVIPAEEGF